MTEQQPFEIVRRANGFDLRRYPEHVVAEITVRAGFDDAGNTAFRSLFGYISGQNHTRDAIAMTAPVVQSTPSQKVAMTAPVVQHEDDDGAYVVAFVLPASMTADTAPAPTNPAVRIRVVPSTLAAASRYTGRWSQAAFETHLARLRAAVVAAGLEPVGAPRFARFDPPIKPWFLRRNEVVLDVVDA